MPFDALPSELVLDISSHLDDTSLGRLTQVAWRYHNLLQEDLHDRAIADGLIRSRKKGTVWMTALEWTICGRKVSLVRYLLEHDVLGLDPLHGTWALLEQATKVRHRLVWDGIYRISTPEIITLLVIKAGELGQMTSGGATEILHHAICCRCWQVEDPDGSKFLRLIELLLAKYGANPAAPLNRYIGYSKKTVLHYLIDHNGTTDVRVLKLLLQYGATREDQIRGMTPLIFFLVKNPYQDHLTLTCIRVVLENGGDLNQLEEIDEEEEGGEWSRLCGTHCLLSLAIMEGHFEAALLLVEFGASVNGTTLPRRIVKFGNYFSPLIAAIESDGGRYTTCQFTARLKLIQRVLELGADPNESDIRCRTAINVALLQSYDVKERAAIIGLLIFHGADWEEKDCNDGCSLLQRHLHCHHEADTKFRCGLDVLVRVTLDNRLADLLPAEYVIRRAKTAIELASREPWFSSKEVLHNAWSVVQEVVRVFQQGQTSLVDDVHHFSKQHHAEVLELLRYKRRRVNSIVTDRL